MDDFHKAHQIANGIGPGGVKCPCCNDRHGVKDGKAKNRRTARRFLRDLVRRILRTPDEKED